LQQIERIDQKLFQTITSIKPSERRLIAITTEQGEIQLSLKATSFKKNDNELVILSIQYIKNELDEKEVESWMKLIRVLMHEIMNSITPITSLSESLSHIYSTEGTPVLPEPEKKLFKVAELMSRVKVLYNSLEKSDRIGLSFSLKDSEFEIYADQNLISQVLINLVKNALEANENNPDGKILIVAGIDKNHHPEICVIDNGPGISEGNLDEIFVPFFTTRQYGSGIGLSISKQIMRVHGGNLKVRSVPNKETLFCLSF
jgi:signal transduction histidine kinase